MKVLVSGSRCYSDYQKILAVISRLDIDLLIAGACRGADTLAVRAARQCGIRYIEYPADWQRFGKGTLDMLSRVRRDGIAYRIFI